MPDKDDLRFRLLVMRTLAHLVEAVTTLEAEGAEASGQMDMARELKASGSELYQALRAEDERIAKEMRQRW